MGLGAVFIIIILLISVVILAVGLRDSEEGTMMLGVAGILLAGLCIAARNSNISDEAAKKLCIKEGKEVVKIVNRDFCKL